MADAEQAHQEDNAQEDSDSKSDAEQADQQADQEEEQQPAAQRRYTRFTMQNQIGRVPMGVTKARNAASPDDACSELTPIQRGMERADVIKEASQRTL